MEKEKIDQLSPLALAFLGDAIHTAFVRLEVLKDAKRKLENYHINAKKLCNAQSQADTLERIYENLTGEEKEVIRHARNSKPKHTAKNFDEKTYKKATAFEALIGFLYVSNQSKRLDEILALSMNKTEV